jgi:hypothetical protein
MPAIHFTSLLQRRHRGDLERMLFFNRKQNAISDAIEWVVEHFGAPQIEEVQGHLRIGLTSDRGVQALFALDGDVTEQLVGLVVFTREQDELLVLFVAVREDYSDRGANARKMLLVRIINEVRGIARRVKGISVVRLIGRGLRPIRIRVR